MINKKTQIVLFLLVALAQLYVPAKMIWDQEDVLKNGSEYKFKTAPVDPNDPFRGKYITLNFDNNTFEVENNKDWQQGDEIYVSITNGSDGFAKIASISKKKPTDQQDFVKATVGFAMGKGSRISIDYPFDTYYMEESKAYGAELTYQRSQLDSTQTTFALVHIKNGKAVLKDVLIDGVPIREIVKKEHLKNESKK